MPRSACHRAVLLLRLIQLVLRGLQRLAHLLHFLNELCERGHIDHGELRLRARA